MGLQNKYKSNSTIKRYKACLIAKEYIQVESIDYLDTFSPMAKLTTLYCFFIVVATRHWFIYQLDIHE